MSSLRNFGLAFLIALLAFAAIAYYSVGLMASLFDPENKSEVVAGRREVKHFDGDIGDDISSDIKSGRTFTALIVGTDHDPAVYSYESAPSGTLAVPRRVTATTIFLVRFDKEKRAMQYCLIPSSTMVEVDYVEMELGKAYAYKGASFIRDQVSGITGVAVDYLFDFSGRQFVQYAPRTPYITPLSEEIPTYKGVAGKSYTEGQYVSIDALYPMLHYDGFPIARFTERTKIVSDLFMQTLVKFVDDSPASYYKKIEPLNTDMTEEDVSQLLELLDVLPLFIDSSEKQTKLTELEFYKCGSFDSAGRFLVDRALTDALFAPYKQ